MKKYLFIAFAILILASVFQAKTVTAAQSNGRMPLMYLSSGDEGAAPSPQKTSIPPAELDLTGTWDILLFYDDGGVNREIWYLTQEGSLITGHSRYRTDEGDVVRSKLTGRLNGSNFTMSLKSGDYVSKFQARISDNGMSMGTKKIAPDGDSFEQTMRKIDEGRAVMEKATPNRYQDGDWWRHKRPQ